MLCKDDENPFSHQMGMTQGATQCIFQDTSAVRHIWLRSAIASSRNPMRKHTTETTIHIQSQ